MASRTPSADLERALLLVLMVLIALIAFLTLI
jgi:hypothetical protein